MKRTETDPAVEAAPEIQAAPTDPVFNEVTVCRFPPDRGYERAPFETIRVVNENAQLETIYTGRGLSAGTVLADMIKHFPQTPDEAAPRPHGDRPFDCVMYVGTTVRFIVRDMDDGRGGFQVLYPAGPHRPAVGKAEDLAPPPAEDLSEPRDLLLAVLRRAARRYHDTDRFQHDAAEAVALHATENDKFSWGRWLRRAEEAAVAAWRELVVDILLAHARVKNDKWPPELAAGWQAVIMELDGLLYVVGPEFEGETTPRLTVVDAGSMSSGQDADFAGVEAEAD